MAPPSITVFLTYMTHVILTTVVLATGCIASVGITLLLVHRVQAIAYQQLRDEKKATQKDAKADETPISLAVVMALMFSTLGHFGLLGWLLDSRYPLVEASMWSTVTLASISIGLAIPAIVIVHISRAILRRG